MGMMARKNPKNRSTKLGSNTKPGFNQQNIIFTATRVRVGKIIPYPGTADFDTLKKCFPFKFTYVARVRCRGISGKVIARRINGIKMVFHTKIQNIK